MSSLFAAPYSAKRQWVESGFEQAASTIADQGHDTSPSRQVCIPWLVALLLHDSMQSLQHYQANVAQMQALLKAGQGADIMGTLHQSEAIGAFAKACGTLTGQRLRLRSGLCLVRSPSMLSNGFVPPPATSVAPCCAALFRARQQDPLRLRNVPVRLASYLILLTIHPFQDGNGRAARLLFAADTLSSGASPNDLLALALMHSNASAQFHLAAKCARLGDFSMLFTCYEAMRHRVPLIFGELTARLSDALANDDPLAVQEAAALLHAQVGRQLQGRDGTEFIQDQIQGVVR